MTGLRVACFIWSKLNIKEKTIIYRPTTSQKCGLYSSTQWQYQYPILAEGERYMTQWHSRITDASSPRDKVPFTGLFFFLNTHTHSSGLRWNDQMIAQSLIISRSPHQLWSSNPLPLIFNIPPLSNPCTAVLTVTLPGLHLGYTRVCGPTRDDCSDEVRT